MYNWRLLLFAFFALFHSIASFTERNLVDGRQQCCDHQFSRNIRFLHDNYRSKLQSEDRRIANYRQEQRDELRNENSLLIRPLRDTVRFTRDREGRTAPISVTRLSLRRSRQMTYSFVSDQNSERDTRTPTHSVDRVRDYDSKRTRYARITFNRRQDTRVKPENNQRLIEGTERYQTSNVRDSNRVTDRRDTTPSATRLDRERSLARVDSRFNVRTVRSVDKIARNIVRDRRVSFTDSRSQNFQRSVTRDHNSINRERINTNQNDGTRMESRQRNEVNGVRTDANDQKRRIEQRVARDRFSVTRQSYNRVATLVSRPERNERHILNLDTERRELKLTNKYRTNIREHSSRANERNRVEIERNNVRQISRINNDERLSIQNRRDVEMVERRQIDRRLENTHNERRFSEHRDTRRESRDRVSRTYDINREQHQDRPEFIQGHDRSRSLDLVRVTHSETRKIEVRNYLNYEVEGRRGIYKERRNKDNFSPERRISAGKMVIRVVEDKLINDRLKNGDKIGIVESTVFDTNWQYLMYAIQGIYFCSILLPFLEQTVTKKNLKSLGWALPSQKLIKVE